MEKTVSAADANRSSPTSAHDSGGYSYVVTSHGKAVAKIHPSTRMEAQRPEHDLHDRSDCDPNQSSPSAVGEEMSFTRTSREVGTGHKHPGLR